MKKPIAIDLFSGCGGLTLGLKLAGFRILAAVDNSELAVKTYKANHPGIRVWSSDIRRVSARSVMRELGIKPGQLDLLAGCPPCQGFSILRTRNGTSRNRDRRNRLIQEILRFARTFQPKVVMLENVPGLKNRRSFRMLCAGLRQLGYTVRCDIKDAVHYGVPQRRKRIILLAGRGFEIPFAPPSAKVRTVWQTIGRLPKPGYGRDALHNMPERRSTKILRLIRKIPKNGGSRGDLPKSRQLACHRDFDGFSDVYGRMSWNAPSPTITSGCFNPSKGRFLHPQANRAITLREAAMLQSFPARYWFPTDAGKEAIALMIGNALPPKFIHDHAIEIVHALKTR